VLFERHKRLLALVDALSGNIGNLDFQKLLFLYCHEQEEKPTYEFVPYHFGGFSFTSYQDKRFLTEKGLFENQERTWVLTSEGRKQAVVSPFVRIGMDRFAKRYSASRGDALIADVYRRFPFYAINSEIAGRIMANDVRALKVIAETRPAPGKPGIVTIGYEGRSLEGYLNQLILNGVTLLCDVRRNAFSHKFGFSKTILSKNCERLGIGYEHLPELGIATGQRQKLTTQDDYDKLFATYREEDLPKQTVSLEKIHNWVIAGKRVALTCFEALPHQCHRSCIADELSKRWGESFKPHHL
jgi:uncharacterized protein (DUF488 family)